MWVPLEDYPKGLFPNDFSILPYMKHSWYMVVYVLESTSPKVPTFSL